MPTLVRNANRAGVVIGVILLLALGLTGCSGPKSGAPKPSAAAPAPPVEPPGVEEVTERALRSLVVISHYGRDGQSSGIGAGFVIDPEGLIATSLHVIGEARPISVHLADGTKHRVREVHAWDRRLDLAILRIDATGLPALPLGDSDTLRQGAPVLALGNPQGLEHSVVRGVMSARREIGEVEMLQLAIPIEPGNSGGPLLDEAGRVQGVLTLKSAVTQNLGFAVPVAALKELLAQPNPVPMERWLTIGALNEREWTPLHGARWTQRAGRLKAEGFGSGFGGRSLCLSRQPVPAPPYEVAVTVKLDDEAGAAGLVFGADGGHQHYGFYPSAGQLRLTRFDGPDVFTWEVLEQVRSRAYRPGEWNTLKVRVEPERLLCYVNDELVIESPAPRLAGTQVGVAKFRNTTAEFKIFQVGPRVGPEAIPAELAATLKQQIADLPPRPDPAWVKALQQHPEASQALLRERARQLEQQARQLRRLAHSVHTTSIETALCELLDHPNAATQLAHAALLIARLDNEELDVAAYLRQLEQMAGNIRSRLGDAATPEEKLAALRRHLFEENGFHGSRSDYYHRANSYLNEVLDDREGLPLTLAVIFLDLATRIGLDNVAATSTPGHVLVKFTPAGGQEQLLDVFEGGRFLTRAEAAELVESYTGGPLRAEHLRSATPRELIARLLRNLMAAAEREDKPEDSLRYLDLIVALQPESALERLSRGMLRLRLGDSAGAREDLQWLLDTAPPGLDLERVAELYRSL
jgi:regulator of sirC expression with transglutaminase-like and TPR domain